MTSRIFHPKLMQHLAKDRFGSEGTVQRRTVVQDSYGDEQVEYQDDALLKAIPCQVQPRTNRGNDEVRRPDQTIVMEPFDILLAGHYPTINEADQLFVRPQLQAHNILKVASGDTGAYTVLTTEIVS